MKIHPRRPVAGRWLKTALLSQGYRTWLIERGSLTTRLQKQFAQFNVQTSHDPRAQALPDELRALQLGARAPLWVREVLLNNQKQALVFAHSVIPHQSLRGDWQCLGKLGNKPLGAALFANPKVKRTLFGYKKLTPAHPLFKRAAHHLNAPPPLFYGQDALFLV